MTEFERNARYSYSEKLAYLQQRLTFPNLQTMSYKGIDVISISGIGKGVRWFFYLDGKLVKIRDWSWKTDIALYARRFIDQCLLKQLNMAGE